jgi:octaprenyl-diphosphate synthase
MELDYASRLQKIEAVLKEALPDRPDADWFGRVFGDGVSSAPITDGAATLTAPCADLLGRGGKRWRPLLSQLVCESLGGGDAALPLAPLVEFCHTASLIHDDIEDGSEERRGRPAVHLLYGTDTAVNSGSFLYFLPLACIDRWDASAGAKLRLYSLWARELRALHLGQAMDIAWHRDADVFPEIADYMAMCALKTGTLARFAALAGCAAGTAKGAETSGVRTPSVLARAAERLGVGFQILDDVRNLEGKVAGKRRGDDIAEGKKSLPVLLFVSGSTAGAADADGAERRRRLVRRCFAAAEAGGAGVSEADELIDAIREAGCLAAAELRGRALLAEAEAAFLSALPPSEPRTLLAALAGRL